MAKMLSNSNTLSRLDLESAYQLFSSIQRGIEKEGLRYLESGILSQEKHPTSLGSSLMHPYITTDYSEALLELITPVSLSNEHSFDFLKTLHQYTYQHINNELIWPCSMPGFIKQETDISIAQYGTSHLGRLKEVYRMGLAHRYGRIMQIISGLHYNYSLNEKGWSILMMAEGHTGSKKNYQSERYFDLIRNMRRHSWLLLYLFSASPAIDASFFQGHPPSLLAQIDHTFFLPYATSLRMSDLGYQNNIQSNVNICYNRLNSYLDSLKKTINTPHKQYQDIGIKNSQGDYQQLNANILQIENEYYSNIRPKRTSNSHERPLTALRNHGVQYIEVRCLDLNPFLPLGINIEQMDFLDLFLTHCLLSNSPKMTPKESQAIQKNHSQTALYGRDPELKLYSTAGKKKLTVWGKELLESMQPLAQLMDNCKNTDRYLTTLNHQKQKLSKTELTPSECYLNRLQTHKINHTELAMQLAQKHKQTLGTSLPKHIELSLKKTARTSLEHQTSLESQNKGTFTDYLNNYLTVF